MKIARLLAALLLSLFSVAAMAEVTKLIIPTAPGGGTDGFFRVIAKDAEPFLGSILIVNVPGAGGTLGVAQMVRAAPDGYTLAGIWLSPVTVAPHTMKVTYTPDDYVPVMQLTSAPYVMCVQPDFPATDGHTLIEAVRKAPGKYSYGTDGVGALAQLATERIFRAFKVSAVDIPYKGAGDTLLGFLGNQIDIYVGSIPPILEYAKTGRAKCVLLTSVERNASLPSASSLKDMGIPGEETLLWRGLLAPKGTPPERVAAIEAAFRKAAMAPGTRKFIEEVGEQIEIKGSADFQKKLRQEYEAMGKVVRSLNLTAK
jgi:tripartite-type tricarboxylate transporter receptor subunit TctC